MKFFRKKQKAENNRPKKYMVYLLDKYGGLKDQKEFICPENAVHYKQTLINCGYPADRVMLKL